MGYFFPTFPYFSLLFLTFPYFLYTLERQKKKGKRTAAKEKRTAARGKEQEKNRKKKERGPRVNERTATRGFFRLDVAGGFDDHLVSSDPVPVTTART